jgi:hypothetical protein
MGQSPLVGFQGQSPWPCFLHPIAPGAAGTRAKKGGVFSGNRDRASGKKSRPRSAQINEVISMLCLSPGGL